MRAVAVRQLRGAPELMDLPPPVPGPGELSVRVAAAGVNPFDWKILDGILSPARPHVFPLVAGVDGAGVVEGVGPGVTRFHPGERVVGQFLHDPVGIGTYAEFATLPESNAVMRVPEGLGSLEAAALPMAGMTALVAVDALGVATGSTILLVGASGGVGSFALPLLRAKGARVIATARPDAADALRRAGAEEVVDPSVEDLPTRIRSLRPDGVDGLLDLASDARHLAANATLVRRGGAAVTTTFSADPEALARSGLRGVNVDMHPSPLLLERVVDAVAGGRLPTPRITPVRLEGASEALALIRAGGARGKMVVDLA